MNNQQIILNLQQKLELFLEKLVLLEEKRLEVFDKIYKLEQVVFGQKREYWVLEERFSALEKWLLNEGKQLLEGKLEKEHLERIIFCMEKIRNYRDSEVSNLEDVLKLSNVFLREALKKLHLEYTPLGLMEEQALLAEQAEFLKKLKGDLAEVKDIRAKYDNFLSYQEELLKSFYKPDEHLLSILDYQLKNLEKSPSKEDEFFVASLLYYLKMNNYKITPYLEKFRKISSAKSEKK